MLSSKRLSILGFVLLLIGFNFYFSSKFINEVPQHIHGWAENDYYAISKGFIRNGFDFFHPQTNHFNKQFPGGYRKAYPNGITSIDFPIHSYAVAILMKVFGTQQPWVYRSYLMLYASLGILALFLTIRRFTENYLVSLFSAVALISSPIFIYYYAGFIPSIPSLSSLLIGVYFYTKYLKENAFKYFLWALFFMGFAALTRTPFGMYLLTMLGVEFLRFFRSYKGDQKKVFKIVLYGLSTIVFVLIYFMYNKYLTAVYGSVFLGKPAPPDNWAEITEILKKVDEYHKFQYLSEPQFWLLYAFLGLGLVGYLFGKKKLEEYQKNFLLFVVVIGVGGLTYSYLMLKQFRHHDYYFMDCLFPFYIFLMVFLLSVMQFNKQKIYLKALFLGGLIFLTSRIVDKAHWGLEERRMEYHGVPLKKDNRNYSNADILLDKLSVSKDAKILVLGSFSTNLPLMLMDREGFTVQPFEGGFMRTAFFEWPYDYITAQIEDLETGLLSEFPEFLDNVELVGTNGKIGVYKRLVQPRKNYLEDLTMGGTNGLFSVVNFDDVGRPGWSGLASISDPKNPSNKVGKCDSEYGITFAAHDQSVFLEPNAAVTIEGKYFVNENSNGNLSFVVNIEHEGKSLFYTTSGLDISEHEAGKWVNKSITLNVPKLTSAKHKLSCYLYNKTGKQVLYDDVKVKVNKGFVIGQDFESKPSEHWSNIKVVDDAKRNSKVGELEGEYGATYSKFCSKDWMKQFTTAKVSGWFNTNSEKETKAYLVFVIEAEGKMLVYNKEDIHFKGDGNWSKRSFTFVIPQIEKEEVKMSFYISKGKDDPKVFYDNLQLSLQ